MRSLWLRLAILAGSAMCAAPQADAEQAMRRYRNGQAVGAPAAAERGLSEADASGDDAGAPLQEEAVSSPAGGVKVNLRGRHRAAVTRRVTGGNGNGHECTQDGRGAHE